MFCPLLHTADASNLLLPVNGITVLQKLSIFYGNYIFKVPTKCTYTIEILYYFQHPPTSFGTYCAIFRENSIACSKLLSHCLNTDLEMHCTCGYSVIYNY
jgi:hypothetical protein